MVIRRNDVRLRFWAGQFSTGDEIIRALQEVIRTYQIDSMIDVPCGDVKWMSRVEFPVVSITLVWTCSTCDPPQQETLRSRLAVELQDARNGLWSLSPTFMVADWPMRTSRSVSTTSARTVIEAHAEC